MESYNPLNEENDATGGNDTTNFILNMEERNLSMMNGFDHENGVIAIIEHEAPENDQWVQSFN